MDSFIKKIFEKNIDDSVHSHLIRFGKGRFENRAVINLKRGNKIIVTSSFEFANDFVNFVFENSDKVNVSGILLSREAKNLKAGKVKKGIYHYGLAKELNRGEFEELKKNSYFLLFDCEAGGISLKINKKLPALSKGKSNKIKDKFCSLEIEERLWPKLHSAFFFDIPQESKKARIIHIFEINEIILPKNEKDFEKLRILAKKVGKISRIAKFNGKEVKKEAGFEV